MNESHHTSEGNANFRVDEYKELAETFSLNEVNTNEAILPSLHKLLVLSQQINVIDRKIEILQERHGELIAV